MLILYIIEYFVKLNRNLFGGEGGNNGVYVYVYIYL